MLIDTNIDTNIDKKKMSYDMPKIKKFSEYVNTNIFLRKCLLQFMVCVVLFIIIVIIIYYVYKLCVNYNNFAYGKFIETFGSRNKCKKLYKSELNDSTPPDECIEEDFTNIPKPIEKIELTSDELSLISRHLQSIINSNTLEEYFNNIKIYADTAYHRPHIRIKFDPQIDIQYILITILSSISTNLNIDMDIISNYCKVYFTVNDKPPTNINKNYNSIDGMLIHSIEYMQTSEINNVKIMLNFADIIDIKLFNWML